KALHNVPWGVQSVFVFCFSLAYRYPAACCGRSIIPLAVKAMLEIGIDISDYFSKTVASWMRKTLTMW
ncbi:MAG: hypothetical protein KAH31_02325, partial [Candidatus Sabulitectum sp.]|nr:hypothetical protein [Candidatus Sabulitectum sp.]